MSEWLITLRKHRNYCLAERQRGFETNNSNSDEPVMYQYGAFSDLGTRIEYGSYCPLTCPIVKHGVMSAELTKNSKKHGLTWGHAADIQSKRTTELRSESEWYSRVNSDVLQGNLAKLDIAYNGFFQHKRGFPAFRKASNFKSFQFKPGQGKLTVNRSSNKKRCYSHVYFPGLGDMRYFDSRAIPIDADIRTVTVIKEADGWYMSVLLNLPESLPDVSDIETISSAVGIDVGINKLISLTDGSFVENPKFATNKKTRRQLRIRQRRVNRKVKGSKNRKKAGIIVAKLHKKIADKRNDHQWFAANKVVGTAAAIVQEDLNIKAMKSRCKPKRQKGRFMANGQSAKRGLNRSISDVSWGGLFSKIAWLALKAGKPVLSINPKFTSQECSACHNVSKTNRDGEKFICENCGHIDHADTQASRTILRRANLKFVTKDVKKLPADCGKVTLVRHDSASNGKQDQGKNRTSKVIPEKRILFEQLSLQLFN
ncbi:transposase [Nostoc sp. CHAB 5836]|uniref:RNA-guided endonuclease InsQ/TnpB family protein n=1 Tax=Nostoc sp. CHAB 5836 TaxID=2780404 RepID=UPI001E5CE89C|nr:transposase [Nostoc sp. CHAB 5836]